MPDILEILHIDAPVLAQQMTFTTADLYDRITASECEAWQAHSKDVAMPEQTPHINDVIKHHNEIHLWALRTIVKLQDQEKQAQAICQFIAIADACRALNNFDTLASIISAMTNDQIQRAIDRINAIARARLAQLERLVSPIKGFIEFRRAIRLAKLPCIPFLGFMLTDLRFIEEGMPSLKRDGARNDAKDSKTKEVIAEILRYQSEPFQRAIRPEIQSLISVSFEDSLGES